MPKHPFLALVLLIITHAAIYPRLNTNQPTYLKLNVGDTIISTFGLFKATLLQNQCLLSIQYFNNSSYVKSGNYTSPNITGNCNSLTIQNGQIVTQSNTTYMYVGSGYSLSTILTIDDIGIIRLIGTYQLSDFINQVSQQFSITSFQKNNSFIFPTTNINIGFIDKYPSYTNNNGWIFSNGFGQLDISYSDDPGLIISYSYSQIKIQNSQILDFNGYNFPNAIYPNITYIPRCYQPRIYLDYKPPFVLVLDPYWPKASVYQQGRYKILQVSYSRVYEAHAWQQNRRLFSRSQPGVCPPYTFQFQGKCGPTCPYPYYYQLRGSHGYCVLTCEQFTPKNDTTRICSCYSDIQKPAISIQTIKSCSANAISYPYGCYCNQTAMFFDSLLTLSCVDSCPQGTYPSQGLCMLCPGQCQSCQIDKRSRAYLQCKICKQNFTLYDGQCYRTCSPGLGFSIIDGKCISCTDPVCLNCSTDANICTRCNPLYAVSNGACLQTCNNGTIVAYYDKMNSICLPLDSTCSDTMSTYYKNKPMLKCNSCPNGLFSHLNKCVDRCPNNYISNTNSYCICSTPNTLTVNDQCLALPSCPLLMGWDLWTSSCLSCNFGCTTCYNLACTSCAPGYFLYISPQAVRCRRQSPLFPCDGQYSWINGACVLTEYSNPLYRLAKCLSTVNNCMACYPNSGTECSICNKGYHNYNNTCLQRCPSGTISYKGQTCIVPQLTNCSLPYFELKHESFVLNNDRISNSQPYLFYTFNGKQMANDPVGYIPYYQTLTVRKTDGLFRDTQFYYPVWTCLKCNDGYGLSSNFYQCLPCPHPCLTCYMALNISCLTLKNNTLNPQPPLSFCSYYIDFRTKQCVQNCSVSTMIPYVMDGILYCYPTANAPTKTFSVVDSSAFITSNGSIQVFFVLDHTIDPSQVSRFKIISQQPTIKVSANNDTAIQSKQKINYVQINNNGYIYYFQPNISKTMFILNANDNLVKIASSNKITLSNTIYGLQAGQGHAAFRKTWLAYIGYIMGLVLICLHVVYIGNDLLYKVDNTLILAQSIYFFSFVKLLAGKLLSQFYYGWVFAHFGFFPNFFVNTIPPEYIQLAAPNSYKLNDGDANIIRNCGWAFSLLLIFLLTYVIITLICWILSGIFNKKDAWHPRIATNSLIAFVQFLSFAVFFWSVANIQYIGNADTLNKSFYNTSRAVSIIFLVVIIFYTVIRWFFSRLGGLYMTKKILIATMLAVAYEQNIILAPLIILEVVFFLFRYFYQAPQRHLLTFMMVLQSLLHIASYLLLFLVLDAGINTIIISVIIFILIVVLSYGLTHIYLQSQNEWQLEQKDDSSQASIVRAQVDRKVSKISME